jgi:hypothetical protein
VPSTRATAATATKAMMNCIKAAVIVMFRPYRWKITNCVWLSFGEKQRNFTETPDSSMNDPSPTSYSSPTWNIQEPFF